MEHISAHRMSSQAYLPGSPPSWKTGKKKDMEISTGNKRVTWFIFTYCCNSSYTIRESYSHTSLRPGDEKGIISSIYLFNRILTWFFRIPRGMNIHMNIFTYRK